MKIKVKDDQIDHSGAQPAVPYKAIRFPVVKGEADVPAWVAAALAGKDRKEIRDELTKAEGHELSAYLHAHGKRDHWFDKKTHYHSQHLREIAENGCPGCGHKYIVKGTGKEGDPPDYNLHEMVASTLDSLHQTVSGAGRIVILTDDERRELALKVHDDQA